MNEEELLISELTEFVSRHGKIEILAQLEDILGKKWMLEKMLEWDFDDEMKEFMIDSLNVRDFMEARED